jgi:hypothetical protein
VAALKEARIKQKYLKILQINDKNIPKWRYYLNGSGNNTTSVKTALHQYWKVLAQPAQKKNNQKKFRITDKLLMSVKNILNFA